MFLLINVDNNQYTIQNNNNTYAISIYNTDDKTFKICSIIDKNSLKIFFSNLESKISKNDLSQLNNFIN